MVSRIEYPHLVNHYLRGPKPFEYLFIVAGVIGLLVWSLANALVLSFCAFALSGIIRSIRQRSNKKAAKIAVSTEITE